MYCLKELPKFVEDHVFSRLTNEPLHDKTCVRPMRITNPQTQPASAQSDQRLCYSLIILLDAMPRVARS